MYRLSVIFFIFFHALSQTYWEKEISTIDLWGNYLPQIASTNSHHLLLLGSKAYNHQINQDLLTDVNLLYLRINGEIIKKEFLGKYSKICDPLLSKIGNDTFIMGLPSLKDSTFPDTISLIAINNNGDKIWTNNLLKDEVYFPINILAIGDGNILMLNGSKSDNNILSMDDKGSVTWDTSVTRKSWWYDNRGDIYPTGYPAPSYVDFDQFHCTVFLLNQDGKIVSTSSYDDFGKSPYDSYPYVMFTKMHSQEKGLIIFEQSYCYGGGVCGPGTSWYKICRLDGNITEIYKSRTNRVVYDVVQLNESKILVAGHCYIENESKKKEGIFLDIFDQNGSLIKENELFKQNLFYYSKIQTFTDTTFLVSALSDKGICLYKFDANTNLLWSREIIEPSQNLQWGRGFKFISLMNDDCCFFSKRINNNGEMKSIYYLYIIADQYAYKDSLFTYHFPKPDTAENIRYTIINAPQGMIVENNDYVSWKPPYEEIKREYIQIEAKSVSSLDTLSFNIFVNGRQPISNLGDQPGKPSEKFPINPNYNKDLGILSLSVGEGEAIINIFNVKGRKVYSQQHNKKGTEISSMHIDLKPSNLAKGYYLLQYIATGKKIEASFTIPE